MLMLIFTLAVVGFCLYLVERFIPMDPVIAVVLRVIVVAACILYVLSAFGVMDMPVPRLRR